MSKKEFTIQVSTIKADIKYFLNLKKLQTQYYLSYILKSLDKKWLLKS
jgi:hypothetical protein